MRRLLIGALGLVLLQVSAPKAQAQYRPGLKSSDDRGRLVGASDNEGRFFRYVHEQDGSREVWWGDRLIAIEKADGTVVAFAYDEHGARIQTRITKPGSQPQVVDHVGGPPVRTARPSTAVAPAAPQPNTTRPHQYGRDAFGHLTTVSTAEGTTVYGYFDGDPRPLVREVAYPDGSKDIYSLESARAAFEALQPPSATTASSSTATATLVPAGSCGGGSANRIGFNGYFWDCEVRLYYTPSGRMYDPTFGRFLQQDSYLGSIYDPPTLHRYTFGRGNPLRYIDPFGHADAEAKDFQYARVRLDTYQTVALIKSGETVDVAASQDPAYALPQTVGRQVAPLNKAAETGVRVTGVALQATAAATLAAVPEPTGLTKAGAAYFAARALDEGQALARELGTGTPTTSFAHRGVSGLYEAAGDDPRTASFRAGLTLMGADFAVGFGAGASPLRASETSGLIEGTVVESSHQVPTSSGSIPLYVPKAQFTPDPTRVLQNITTANADALAANPALARTVLTRPEYLAGQRSPRVAVLNYGKAAERLPAQEIRESPLHRQLFDYASGPYRPDFTGVPGSAAAGMNFDITTPGQVGAHLARQGYGPGLNVVTYQRSPLFKLFP